MLAGVDLEERVAEHLRRLTHAYTWFWRRRLLDPPSNALWRLGPGRLRPMGFDDRGITLVRHGPPSIEFDLNTTQEVHDLANLEPLRTRYVAWFYRGGPAGNRLFEFVNTGDRQLSDYVLIEPTPMCRGGHVLDGSTRGNYAGPGVEAAWAARVMGFNSALGIYYGACDRGSFFAAGQYLAQRSEARRNADVLAGTESGREAFNSPLTAAVNLYAFPGRDGTALVAYFGISGETVSGTPSPSGGMEYRVNARLAAGELQRRSVFERDTLLVFSTGAPLQPGAVVSTALALQVPDSAELTVVLTLTNDLDERQGQLLTGLKDVAASQAGIRVSDVVVAAAGSGSLVRRGRSLRPLLGHVIERGAEVRIYQEISNVATDDSLEIEITIAPTGSRSLLGDALRWIRGGENSVAVSFREVAAPDADGYVVNDRTLQVPVQPGIYALTSTVRHLSSGRTASAETSLVVVEMPER